MGKQSSRIYYQGKDHKDIYFQGHYHDAMYVGDRLVWEKLEEKMYPLLASELGAEYVIGDDIVDDVTMFEDGSLCFENVHIPHKFFVFRGDSINKTLYANEDNVSIRKLNGTNYGYWDKLDFTVVVPGENIFHDNTGNDPPTMPAFTYCGYINNLLFICPVLQYGGDVGRGAVILDSTGNPQITDVYLDGEKVKSYNYTFRGTTYTMHALSSEGFQWFAGKLHANLSWGDNDYGVCYTSDMLHWYSGSPISPFGRLINGLYFPENGTIGFNESMGQIEFTKLPAFYCNGYYYAEEMDGNYILRSKDLVNWARYKEIKWEVDLGYTLKGYWRQKNLLLLMGKDKQHMINHQEGIYKYRIHL